MAAVRILMKAHQEIKELLNQFEAAGERAYKTKQEIAEMTFTGISAHYRMEEQIFYPAIQARAGMEIRKFILAEIEEHHFLNYMIQRIRETKPDDATFDAKYSMLSSSIRQHIREEEVLLFPLSRTILTKEELDRMGAEMETLGRKMVP